MAQTSENLIYQNKSSKLNLIENGDNFLLYNVDNEYSKSPNLNDDKTKSELTEFCLLYTSPSPRDAQLSRMPSSA